MVATTIAAAALAGITVFPPTRRFTGARPAIPVLVRGGYREHAEHRGERYGRRSSGIGVYARGLGLADGVRCDAHEPAHVSHSAQWSTVWEARLREERIR